MIILGTVLLKMPFATRVGHMDTVDALFTSTSAVCVTGLIVVDTGSFFTIYGQLIILALIQAGGLGIVIFSVLFYFLMGKNISVRSKLAIEGTFGYESVKDIVGIVKNVFLYTVVIECIGGIILFLRWSQVFSLKKACYLSVFHSISAFCNAGFSLFSESLLAFKGDWWVNITVMCLIVSGGIGFFVLYELKEKTMKPGTRFSLHSKVVISTSAFLIVSGAILFLFTEWQDTLKGLSLSEKTIVCLFQSVTARTAGFNTIDIGALNNATLFGLILLMFIGASPGSCGGGIKTTNLYLLLSLTYNRLKGKEVVSTFKRTVPQGTVVRSISLVMGSIMFLIFMVVIFLVVEERVIPQEMSNDFFVKSIFELTSAFGTVGLSMGLTPYLDTIGKIIVAVTIFVGRLGLLTLAFALAKRKIEGEFLYGEENILIS